MSNLKTIKSIGLCSIFTVTLALFASAQTVPSMPVSAPMFTPEERAAIVSYWNQPGRLTAHPPLNIATKRQWRVRLTADGSKWLLKYQIAEGAAGAPPTVNPTAISGTSVWQTWVNERIAMDRFEAYIVAQSLNNSLMLPTPVMFKTPPPDPGPIPPTLLAACGNPPPFANAVAPQESMVVFNDGDTYTYQDNPRMSPGYAYYRFPAGSEDGGQSVSSMSQSDLDGLFKDAGLNPSQTKVAESVSRLEGGFDAINTYDTGYVSIGFLQFITAKNGDGDLMHVLAREKSDNLAAFDQDFHRFGIDITPQGVLDVVDPTTGAELVGTDAVQDVIDFKTLTAVFQRAGRTSHAFRVAQIETALHDYWPAAVPISVTVNGTVITGVVSDVVHSEAGMAVLFDRLVNRGSINPFPVVLQQIMQQHNFTTLAQTAPYEKLIIQKCVYRTNFLNDPNLSQPQDPPADTGSNTTLNPAGGPNVSGSGTTTTNDK